nr:hypothetical protein [Pedobacter sp. ASV19]
MSSIQDKEFAAFGIINNKLKAGLIIGLLSLSLTFNIYLTFKLISVQGDLYEKMLQRVDSQVDKKLQDPVNKINAAIDRVDTAAKVADSASRHILQKQKIK